MKVAGFNVNSLRVRLPIVLRWLADYQPNILCVQETKVQDNDFPIEAFDETEYRYVFKGQKSYNGVAIFSRNEITNVKFGFEDEPKDEARLIKAEINGIVIVNTYIPQGYLPESQKFEYKLNWFSRLLAFFEKNFKPTDPVLWVGDLNVAPQPIDVYVFRMHCKEAGQYTFWDYRLNSFQRNLGWRLDHIMATKPLAKKCTACYIDAQPRLADRPSDHTPIIAEFDW